jgi:hypothetical protein
MTCEHCGKNTPHYRLDCIPDEQVMVRREDIEIVTSAMASVYKQAMTQGQRETIDRLRQALN